MNAQDLGQRSGRRGREGVGRRRRDRGGVELAARKLTTAVLPSQETPRAARRDTKAAGTSWAQPGAPAQLQRGLRRAAVVEIVAGTQESVTWMGRTGDLWSKQAAASARQRINWIFPRPKNHDINIVYALIITVTRVECGKNLINVRQVQVTSLKAMFFNEGL